MTSWQSKVCNKVAKQKIKWNFANSYILASASLPQSHTLKNTMLLLITKETRLPFRTTCRPICTPAQFSGLKQISPRKWWCSMPKLRMDKIWWCSRNRIILRSISSLSTMWMNRTCSGLRRMKSSFLSRCWWLRVGTLCWHQVCFRTLVACENCEIWVIM